MWKVNNTISARINYKKAIEINSHHANSWHSLAHLNLHDFNFSDGWQEYEARWFTKKREHQAALKTSKPRWDGSKKNNRLFVWGEQGIGDQILYASMLNDLMDYPQRIIVSVDKKLISIFQRAFPKFHIVDKNSLLSGDLYDEQIPIGSLGNLLRPDVPSFRNKKFPYLATSSALDSNLRARLLSNRKILCGLSWKSGRANLGKNKSIPLEDLTPILNLKNIGFINVQYGEVNEEISQVKNSLGLSISSVEYLDLFEDVDSLLSILGFCDLVVTSSNSTAHLAGALGKETLLLLPLGYSKFWYWHDIDGVSLWYPSIRIFKQEKPGDWSAPIFAVKAYLEKRLEI